MSLTRQNLKNFLLGKPAEEENDLKEILKIRSSEAIQEGVTLEAFLKEIIAEAQEAYNYAYEN